VPEHDFFLLVDSSGGDLFVRRLTSWSHCASGGRAGFPNGALSSGTVGLVYGVVSGGALRVDELSAPAAMLRGPKPAVTATMKLKKMYPLMLLVGIRCCE
jgi:hypothetical protein